MSFWSNVSPRRAARDLRDQLLAPNPYRWRALALAGAVTFSIFLVMYQQEGRGPPKPHEVIYFPTLPENMTPEEMRAMAVEATRQLRAEEADEEARQERIRQLYKTLGNATGVDTDTAYNQGKAEREAAKKAEEAEAQRILREHAVKPQ
jgi:hypothetical protein